MLEHLMYKFWFEKSPIAAILSGGCFSEENVRLIDGRFAGQDIFRVWNCATPIPFFEASLKDMLSSLKSPIIS